MFVINAKYSGQLTAILKIVYFSSNMYSVLVFINQENSLEDSLSLFSLLSLSKGFFNTMHANLQIYTLHTGSLTFFAGGEGPGPVVQGGDVPPTDFLRVRSPIHFLLHHTLENVK